MLKLPVARICSAFAWYFLGAALLALVVASYATALVWAPTPLSTILGMLLMAVAMAFLWRWCEIQAE